MPALARVLCPALWAGFRKPSGEEAALDGGADRSMAIAAAQAGGVIASDASGDLERRWRRCMAGAFWAEAVRTGALAPALRALWRSRRKRLGAEAGERWRWATRRSCGVAS
jgi:hypothetical protein